MVEEIQLIPVPVQILRSSFSYWNRQME